MATIILTGGGSAGHCIPNVILLPYLKKHFDKIYYIGSFDGIERKIVENCNITYLPIKTTKLVRKFTLKNLKIPFILFNSIKKSGKILDKIKPDVVFSKGGYVALPTVIASKKRKIPVICHESDLSLGLANKISSKFCDKVLTTFKETAIGIKNGEYVGPIIKKPNTVPNKSSLYKKYGFDNNKPVLLVFGGSLGAKAINDGIYNCLNYLTEKYNVFHITGKNNKVKIKKTCYYQTDYLSDMDEIYSICDYALSRAGSNAVFELLIRKIPAVLIPLPKEESRGDQIENANYFSNLGVVKVLNQNDFNLNSLMNSLSYLEKNKDVIKNNINKANITDNSEKITNLLSSYIKP